MRHSEPTGPEAPPFEIVAPKGGSLEGVVEAEPLRPFSEEAVSFLADLSASILRSRDLRPFPELTALGFWMRPGSVKRLSQARGSVGAMGARHATESILAARGTVFHVAPSNVDTIFVYSWLVSLLAGNCNVVRLSRRAGPQIEALLGVIVEALDRHPRIGERTLLVRFDPEPRTLGLFSGSCDVRVVWGGDATVAEIRRSPLPPLSSEVVFGDRFSLGVLRAAAWLDANDGVRERIVRGLVNDAYWFMQMACSSPRLLVWIGSSDEIPPARDEFWPRVRAEVSERAFDLSPRDYVSKRAASIELAIEQPARIEPEPTGDLARVWVEGPSLEHRTRHCGAGLFWETGLDGLDGLDPWLERRVQTVTHFGFSSDDIAAFLRRSRAKGGDRWVPFGQALDFDTVWDGIDLIAAFTRTITLIA